MFLTAVTWTAGIIVGIYVGAFLVGAGKEILIWGIEKIEDWVYSYRAWKQRKANKNK